MSKTPLDPRLNPYRADLAAQYLEGRIRAPRYAAGEERQVVAPQAPIRQEPHFDAELATEALCGEQVMVYEIRDGWAWVQLLGDSYVGYTPIDTLSKVIEPPTHRVIACASFVYPDPDIKTPPIMRLSFGAEVAAEGREGRFLALVRGGYIYADHLCPAGAMTRDFVRAAERLVGTPYLWGGKTSYGLDCSGLVQLALQDAGIACPRDADLQEKAVGEALENPGFDDLKRGDLLFWPGHVAIVHSADWILHASAHQMETVIEPLRRALERIAETGTRLRSVRRISAPEAEVEAEAETDAEPEVVSEADAQPQAEEPGERDAQGEPEPASTIEVTDVIEALRQRRTQETEPDKAMPSEAEQSQAATAQEQSAPTTLPLPPSGTAGRSSQRHHESSGDEDLGRPPGAEAPPSRRATRLAPSGGAADFPELPEELPE